MDPPFVDDSLDSDESSFIPNTPTSPSPLVVPKTPKELWTTPEYERRMERRVACCLFPSIRGDMEVQKKNELPPESFVPQTQESDLPPDVFVPETQETQPPSGYVPDLGHEMLKLLVPAFFKKKSS